MDPMQRCEQHAEVLVKRGYGVYLYMGAWACLLGGSMQHIGMHATIDKIL